MICKDLNLTYNWKTIAKIVNFPEKPFTQLSLDVNLLHNHSTTIKTKRVTFLWYYHLIYRPYPNSTSCPTQVPFLV